MTFKEFINENDSSIEFMKELRSILKKLDIPVAKESGTSKQINRKLGISTLGYKLTKNKSSMMISLTVYYSSHKLTDEDMKKKTEKLNDILIKKGWAKKSNDSLGNWDWFIDETSELI